MNFNEHSDLRGSHAFMSPSQYHWIRYDDQKILDKLNAYEAMAMGTRKHEFAEEAILLGQKLGGPNTELKLFVNDAIGYRMSPEVILYYSRWCYGTVDAISFRRNLLRIHDLKTGVTKASMDQLLVYTAIFCLEYNFRPSDIKVELRIYQNSKVLIHIPEVDEIAPIMDKIVWFDKLIDTTMNE